MPYKKQYKKPYAKRKPHYKKKRTYKKKGRTNMPFKKQPFMHYERGNMKYAFNNDVTASINQNLSGTEMSFTLNDINRPYVLQGAGDPLPQGHLQYSQAFSKFKVYSAKVNLELNPNISGKQCTLLVQLNNSQNYGYNIQTKSAQAIHGLQNTWSYPLPTDRKFKWSKYVSFKQLEAITHQQFDSDLTYYSGTITNVIANLAASQPQRLITWKFSLINETDGTQVQIPFEVNINYYCTFYSRSRLVQSSSV